MIYNLLLCLGDSLTLGSRDIFGRNYPLELGYKLSQLTGEEWYCITEAVNKRTSSDLARDAYSIAVRYTDVYGVILLIGTNDSRLEIPDEIYLGNLQQTIRVCKILGKKIYLLSIPHVSFKRHFLWYGESSAARINSYNKLMPRIQGVHFFDLAAHLDDGDLIDGVHFTHDANEKIAELLAHWLIGRSCPCPRSAI